LPLTKEGKKRREAPTLPMIAAMRREKRKREKASEHLGNRGRKEWGKRGLRMTSSPAPPRKRRPKKKTKQTNNQNTKKKTKKGGGRRFCRQRKKKKKGGGGGKHGRFTPVPRQKKGKKKERTH